MKILFVCGLLMLLSHSVSGRQIQIRVESSDSVLPTMETDESTKPQPEERYEKFRRQHIKKDMTEKKCDSVIQVNKIYNVDNSCKITNTFILADPKKVKAICKGEGKQKADGFTYSNSKFNIVVCKLKKQGARKPNCQYRGSRRTNRVVVVVCKDGLPVHYDKDIASFVE
ncbi:hypothetical protein Q5P01_005681 [Channa striata]|uniref:Ribonuclease A-domain domain-containing protein n=1 Tax=Channa striata TaxID=64152 RepID=A0AA88T3A5_CHASR|nr:hypothetical protein Q5P01_005681 [Channa striata]